ncbi:MAG: type II toxin-antitoxin system PrlF family antitoxin [Paracoccaceae bacterium]
MQESTVTVKGQTTLPRKVRIALGLIPGDRVGYLLLDGGEVRIVRRPASMTGTMPSQPERLAITDTGCLQPGQGASAGGFMGRGCGFRA